MQNQDDYTVPLSEIVSRFPGHVFWKNKQGVYLGCNLELALSTGFANVDEMVGKTDFDNLDDAAEAESLREIDEQVMASGEIYVVEETVLLKGEERVFISKKAPTF